MQNTNFEKLVQLAFADKAATVFAVPPSELYQNLINEEAAYQKQHKKHVPESLSFAFERVRLAVSASLIKIYTELSDNPESSQVLELLLKASKAPSVAAIDNLMHENIVLFENLFIELFEDELRNNVLQLFEETLQIDSVEELHDVIDTALAVLENE